MKTPLLTTTLAILATAGATAQSTVTEASLADSGYINSEWDGTNPVLTTSGGTNANFIGAMNSTAPGQARQAILAFNLPTLTESFSSAIISFDMRSSGAVSSAPWFNVDAYGFTSTPIATDAYIGSNDTSKTFLADSIITPATTDGETISFDIAPYLNTLYTAGNPNVSTLYIRLNPDDPDGTLGTGGDGFGRYLPIFFSGADESLVTLTIVPEPASYATLLGALALAATIIRRRK